MGWVSVARLAHLVVVVPGIAGSVLRPPKDAGEGAGRWELTLPALAGAVRDPTRLDLDRWPELVPTGLVRDLALLPPLVSLPGYRRLYYLLQTKFDDVRVEVYRPPAPVDPRTDVLVAPYDFRRSVVEASQRLDEAVQQALHARGQLDRGGSDRSDRPVIVIGHSMGGLVARHWAAVGQGWRHCAALVTLGTPHRGAPKALDWLINGAGVRGLRDRRATQVIRGWPSVYELLPQYDAVWDEAAGKPLELVELPTELLSVHPDLGRYAGRFAEMARRARQVHDDIRTAWQRLDPDLAPAMLPYMGRGHATPNLVTLKDGRLWVSKKDPTWRGNVGWRGDGTVPAISAIPHELAEERHRHLWRVVADRHGPLGSTAGLVEVLRSYAGGPIPTRGDLLLARPWLGLDLDEYALSELPVPVGAVVLPAGQAAARVEVSITALDEVAPRWRGQLHPTGVGVDGAQVWAGELPPVPAGAYEVAMEALDVQEVESVAAADTLVVLDQLDSDQGGE